MIAIFFIVLALFLFIGSGLVAFYEVRETKSWPKESFGRLLLTGGLFVACLVVFG